MNVIDPVLDRHDEGRVAGDPRMQRRHAVEDQRLVGLIEIKARRKAEAQDRVALGRVLLHRYQLVAVALREVGGEKHVLLQDAFLLEFLAHVVCEGMLAADQVVRVAGKEARQLLRSQRR